MHRVANYWWCMYLHCVQQHLQLLSHVMPTWVEAKQDWASQNTMLLQPRNLAHFQDIPSQSACL